ncbi:class E sortase [Streptomyces sp. NPDC008313]|uniref:class E sortase n=1 Tax=Streptomyces sp. NPDC008313 TaxID=3364826 RepID=UPI0036E35345
MTALRPERESGSAFGDAGEDGSSYGQQPYGVPGAFEAAVDRLADPLTDPLPGTRQPAAPVAAPGDQGWYTPEGDAPDRHGATPGAAGPPGAPGRPGAASYGSGRHRQVHETEQPPYGAQQPAYAEPAPPAEPLPVPVDDETVALRIAEVREAAGAKDEEGAAGATGPAAGGRAARRKASRRHGRHTGAQEAAGGPADQPNGSSQAPLSRVEARRAARARKPGAAVIVSRVIGEVFITAGVLMLLFVTYQLWWSNIRAHQQAGSAAHHLQEDWEAGKRKPDAFAPGQGFAILHIPKLDVVTPIAEGISKSKVLDRGMVGHYDEDSVKTAMPDAKTGNFGLAGHRNTHGEPFRYINRLKPGDRIVVETQDTYYVYEMTSILPVTPPSNTSVLDAVPKGSGFTKPGRYITLTTCTPEFTSKYRMIVWGKMVEERPRSKGKPDALVH